MPDNQEHQDAREEYDFSQGTRGKYAEQSDIDMRAKGELYCLEENLRREAPIHISITIVDIVVYVHREFLKALEQEDSSLLNSVLETLSILQEVADNHGDRELSLLLDDMIYILQEVSYSSGKVECAKGTQHLPSIAERVEKLGRS